MLQPLQGLADSISRPDPTRNRPKGPSDLDVNYQEPHGVRHLKAQLLRTGTLERAYLKP